VLHAARSNRSKGKPHLFVTMEKKDRLLDLSQAFKDKSILVSVPNLFCKVIVREDLLAIRTSYIKNMVAAKDTTAAAENLDPDFKLQYGHTVDILFFDFDAAMLPTVKTWSSFTIASKPPAPGTPNVAIGYHYGAKYSQQDVNDEHHSSIPPPALSVVLFCNHRAVSVGKVTSVGTGLITDVSTMEVGSSGAPKLSLEAKNLTVFAISVGGYYDKPIAPKPDWTEEGVGNLYNYDVQLPEPGRSDKSESRNRNILLGLHHSCVKQMLANI